MMGRHVHRPRPLRVEGGAVRRDSALSWRTLCLALARHGGLHHAVDAGGRALGGLWRRARTDARLQRRGPHFTEFIDATA